MHNTPKQEVSPGPIRLLASPNRPLLLTYNPPPPPITKEQEAETLHKVGLYLELCVPEKKVIVRYKKIAGEKRGKKKDEALSYLDYWSALENASVEMYQNAHLLEPTNERYQRSKDTADKRALQIRYRNALTDDPTNEIYNEIARNLENEFSIEYRYE